MLAWRRWPVQGWLAIAGVGVALAVTRLEPLSPPAVPWLRVTAWMAAAGALGFALRVSRRWLFFVRRLSLHEALAFESMFQGAILLNPQLRYPDAECELLAAQTASTPGQVYPWFRVRTASAVVLPLVLASTIAALAGRFVFALALAFGGLAWTAIRAAGTLKTSGERARTVGAVGLGAAAAVAEGLAFAQALQGLRPDTPLWAAMLTHTMLLTAFELSPFPLALGAVEVASLAASALLGAVAAPLVAAQGYRLTRMASVLPLLLLYLPRWKMSIADIYDPRLPLVLSRRRRHARAIRPEPLADGPTLSVVIPAYNEATRLPRYLPEVIAFTRAIAGGAEIIVVDDGSRDGTADYVRGVAAQEPMVHLQQLQPNRGKGAAVQRGVAVARGQYVLFADADGATPIAECARLLRAAQRGADVVIASRRAPGAEARRDRSPMRLLVGSVFYRVTNLLAVPGIFDTQCGFKLFRAAAARRLFSDLRERGWAFDVALLFRAQKLGMVIEEVPTNWTAIAGSKIRPRDAVAMLIALLRIRRRDAGLTSETDLLEADDAASESYRTIAPRTP